MRNLQWMWVSAAYVPIAILAPRAYGAAYLNVEQAQQAIFAGQKFTPAFVTLTVDQAREVERRSDVNVRNREIQIWRVSNGGYFVVDEVVGKHDFITYAIGLNSDGTVKQIEIMIYRESYGYEVRNIEWRNQFIGKNSSAPLKLNQDIKNISGATLSSRHVADGVKRILATYEVAFK